VLGSVLVAAGGYVLNDVFDYSTDTASHRDRVLPRGEINRATATVLALVLLIASPCLFLPINRLSFIDASLAALLLFLYSWRLKRSSGILGNLVVALLAANAALIGGFALDNLASLVSLGVPVFLATLAREIVKDIQDMPGDRATRSGSLPMLVGPQASSRLAALFLLLAVPATYLPYGRTAFGAIYLIAASLVNVLVVVTAIQLAAKPGRPAAPTQRPGMSSIPGMPSIPIKAEMFLYIVIFFLAALSDTLQGIAAR
jgi:geranylgeranylglycerol-phosphate geranylgeranyltransferase